jgi:hypothetical protein
MSSQDSSTKSVDAYIAAKPICHKLRALIWKAGPDERYNEKYQK